MLPEQAVRQPREALTVHGVPTSGGYATFILGGLLVWCGPERLRWSRAPGGWIWHSIDDPVEAARLLADRTADAMSSQDRSPGEHLARKSPDRITEVQIMHDAPTVPTIPGWRLIISDAGRFWAIRNRAFPRTALRAGTEPTVDADTFEEVREAVAKQEEKARDAVEGVPS